LANKQRKLVRTLLTSTIPYNPFLCSLFSVLFEETGMSAPQPTAVIRTSDSQLFCCKSIDKLISDSEDPEHSLKKTLGPISLTALGIGAVIGSGIFTVIGTAIAGQKSTPRPS
jgi:hypothetical protein